MSTDYIFKVGDTALSQPTMDEERDTEIKKLQKDAERLDWIARQNGEFTSGIIQDRAGDGNYYVHGIDVYGEASTFRGAIDAAMKEEGRE